MELARLVPETDVVCSDETTPKQVEKLENDVGLTITVWLKAPNAVITNANTPKDFTNRFAFFIRLGINCS
jgi:hypothetical protein